MRIVAIAGLGLLAVGGARATVVGGRLGTGRQAAPALRVYAWARATGHLYSLGLGAATTWNLDLPPGRYWLFAGLEGPGAPPVYAAYTDYVRCLHRHAAGSGECDGHQIAEVDVGSQPRHDLDLTDWALSDDSASAIDSLLGRPPADPYDASSRAAPKFSEYPARPGATAGVPAREPTGYHEADREAVYAAWNAAANFAGRLQLVPVSCGAGCSGVAMLDHATGAVRYPVALNPLPDAPACESRASLQYRRDSRLLIVRSAGPKAAAATQAHYYTVEGDNAELRLVTTRTGSDVPGPAHCAPGERAGR